MSRDMITQFQRRAQVFFDPFFFDGVYSDGGVFIPTDNAASGLIFKKKFNFLKNLLGWPHGSLLKILPVSPSVATTA